MATAVEVDEEVVVVMTAATTLHEVMPLTRNSLLLRPTTVSPRMMAEATRSLGGLVECILGSAQVPLSNRHFKQIQRQVADAAVRAEAPSLKWSNDRISFDHEDHPRSTKSVGIIPLVCMPTINNIAIKKMLIDGGAGLNIISIDTYKKMQLPLERLMPTGPFFGVTDGATTPLGQVRLPVTFGTRENYCTEYITFDVPHIALPYNVILGYPALAKFMVVAHHAYNIIKIPGSGGTIAIRCDEADAFRSVEHVYKEATAAFPTDEDLVEHVGGSTRRKQFISQERAVAKRSAEADELVELPNVSAIKKPQPSSTPSSSRTSPATEDLAELIPGPARKMPFAQERATTKKTLLSAHGSGATLTIGACLKTS
jgi:hypothetical protein